MKICFLAGTLGRGGAERQLVYMLRALTGAGARARVLCLTQGEPFEREIERLGVPIEWVGASPSRSIRLYRITKALRREPADIVQSAHFYTNLYTAVAARIAGAQDIGAIRNNLTSELQADRIFGQGHLRLPRHLIANSALARSRAIERGISPARIDVVSNAVDMGEGNGKPCPNEDHALRILFAGRLTEQKRPDRFLRIVSKVMQRLPNQAVRATMVGDGPLRASLKTLAIELGLAASRLELLGERSDMSEVYRQADLLMLTSDWEGTPNVLLEAMSYGIPIAATRVGGVPEIVGDDRGLLASPDDEDELTTAAMRLITDANLRAKLGRYGRQYVARFHSLEALQKQLMLIYQRILSR